MSSRHAVLVVWLARVLSCGYLLLGIVGLLRTGFAHYSNVTGVSLLGFTVNPNTNVIHLCVGLVGIPMATSPLWARRFLVLAGLLGVPWAIAGFALDGSLQDFFASNPALNLTHLVTAAAALLLGLWPFRLTTSPSLPSRRPGVESSALGLSRERGR
jgi:hypothetical protein